MPNSPQTWSLSDGFWWDTCNAIHPHRRLLCANTSRLCLPRQSPGCSTKSCSTALFLGVIFTSLLETYYLNIQRQVRFYVAPKWHLSHSWASLSPSDYWQLRLMVSPFLWQECFELAAVKHRDVNICRSSKPGEEGGQPNSTAWPSRDAEVLDRYSPDPHHRVQHISLSSNGEQQHQI